MVNNTEEKGLVKVNDSIFAKIRRFFMLKFGKKQNEFAEIKIEELNDINDEKNNIEKSYIEQSEKINDNKILNEEKIETEEVYEAKEEIERKLMNYYESIKKCI